MPPRFTDPVPRFWAKVNKRGPDECWPWTGATEGRGYGHFSPRKPHQTGAHRYSWELANGRPVPDGMLVCHTCDNPPCVNPAHLWIGTYADNARDAAVKGRNPGNRTDRGRPKPKYPPAVVMALRQRGLTFKQIGAQLGISAATAYRTLHRYDRTQEKAA